MVQDAQDGDGRYEGFWVRGAGRVVGGVFENVYLHDTVDGWFGGRTSGSCDGRPGDTATGAIGYACSAAGGTQVRYLVSTAGGLETREVAGAIKGAPALVGSDAGGALLVVQGTNGNVYHRTVSADGDAGPGWTRIEAGARGGVSASGTL